MTSSWTRSGRYQQMVDLQTRPPEPVKDRGDEGDEWSGSAAAAEDVVA